MKNMMRRTVAFMLMACLLLSVMAPTAFAAKTDTVTYSGAYYDFGTADKSTIAYGNFTADMSVTKDGNATLYSWTTTVGSSYQSNCLVNNNILGFRGNSSTYYIAVKLTGLADETATYTFDMRTYTSHAVAANIYLLAGNTTPEATAQFVTDGFKINGTEVAPVMTLAKTANYNNIATVEITEDMVHDDGSVIMLINGPKGAGYNYKLASLRLTRKVTLSENVNQNIVVGENAVLDLNGNTVTGSVTCTGGQVVGTGGVNGTFNAEGNELLPLKDSTGVYHLYSYEARKTSVEGTTYNEYWFDVEFTDDAAYALLAAQGTLTITLEWIGEDGVSGVGSKTVAAGNIVADWAAAESASTDDYGMFVQVAKASVPADVTYVDVTPVFTSESGATIEFGKISISYNTEA